MPDHSVIYRQQAETYDLLISKQPSLLPVIRSICPLSGGLLDAVDAGAGTGRLAAVLAPHVRSLTATDASETMLQVAARKLEQSGLAHWRCAAADNRQLPLPDRSADLVVSGWSVCYLASRNATDHEANLARVLEEYKRILRPGGTIILFETMGTGTAAPSPPDFLLPYYEALTGIYGFQHRTVRLDYTFDSVEQAVELSRFFFGEELARQVERERWTSLPEYAGVWWLTV